jgi:hypothetical protein
MDTCVGTTCRHDPVGFADTVGALNDPLACPGERVPRTAVTLAHRAERAVTRASSAPAPRRKKLLKRARSQLQTAIRRVNRAQKRSKLHEPCASTVRGALRAMDARVGCLQ